MINYRTQLMVGIAVQDGSKMVTKEDSMDIKSKTSAS